MSDIERIRGFEWLNIDFLQPVLRDYYKNNNLHIKNVKLTTEVPKGENFTSNIIRIQIEYHINEETRLLALVVKHILTDSQNSENLSQTNSLLLLFQREKTMYENLLPQLVPIVGQLAPTYFPSRRPYTLLLEDLYLAGYQCVNRFEKFDLKHALFLVKNLAKLHVGSLVLYQKNPEIPHFFEEDFEPIVNQVLYSDTYLALAEEIESWSGYERFGPKMREFSKISRQTLEKFHDSSYGHVQVVVHRDCWATNVFFRYDEKTKDPNDIRFIDYQLSNWYSPAVDLAYFAGMGLQIEVLDKHWEVIIESYLTEIFKWIDHFHLDPKIWPIRDDFIKEMEEVLICAPIACFSFMHLILCQGEFVPTLKEAFDGTYLEKDSNWRKSLRTPLYKENMQKLLLFCEKKNYFL